MSRNAGAGVCLKISGTFSAVQVKIIAHGARRMNNRNKNIILVS